MNGIIFNSEDNILRHQAEIFSENNPDFFKTNMNETDTIKLIHELEVHKIELEMQNEALLQAKIEAQEIAKKFTNLYNLAPSGYFTVTPNGKIIGLNQSGAQLLKKSHSQLLESQFGYFVKESCRQTFYDFLEKIIHTATKQTCELEIIDKKDRPIYIQLTGIVNANLKQCELTAVDITSLKLTKLKLQESQNILNSTIESPQEVNILSIDKNFHYLSFNKYHKKTMYNSFGVEVKLGTNILQYFKNDALRINTQKHFEKALKGESHSVEESIKHDTLLSYWLTKYSPIIDENKAIAGATAYSINITAQKTVEFELLKAKEKAEESNKLKTSFLQNINHEIRTPMNMIMGFSNLMIDDFDNKEQLSNHVKIVNNSCNDLLNIITEILNISRLETGQETITWEVCHLKTFFSEIEQHYKLEQKLIGKQHIAFSLNIPLDINNINIITDKTKLRQIFTNLITNAFKFTNEGTITGGCKLDSDNKIIFYIADSGIGIPANKQEAIFERFVQLNKKPNNKGTGLGLSIVKELLALLGGEIHVESSEGKGSTFYFSIPYATDPQLIE